MILLLALSAFGYADIDDEVDVESGLIQSMDEETIYYNRLESDNIKPENFTKLNGEMRTCTTYRLNGRVTIVCN